MEKQKDIRLNKDYRTAYIKDFRRFLESNKDNPKYEAYLSAKTLCKTRIDDAFKLATKVVHRVYKPKDVSTLQATGNNDGNYYPTITSAQAKVLAEQLGLTSQK